MTLIIFLMKHIYKFLLALLILLLLVLSIFFYESKFPKGKIVQITNSEGYTYEVEVEVADTPELQMKGLMYREEMDEDAGMWFPYSSERDVTFWMKNTFIPLDMLFIGSNFEIVDVIYNVPACTEDPCEMYSPIAKSQYVLEVNGGFSEKNNIRIGDKVSLIE
jgi:hypothetical protein